MEKDIKIVGVVQPTESASATMLQTGIGYPAALTTHVIEQAKSSDIVKNNCPILMLMFLLVKILAVKKTIS